MNIKIFLIAFLGWTTVFYSQNQDEQDSTSELKKSQNQMNLVYNKILKKYKNDSVFILQLKNAQISWVKYRNAEILAKFPHTPANLHYGSVYPVCYNFYATELTNERTERLKTWLAG